MKTYDRIRDTPLDEFPIAKIIVWSIIGLVLLIGVFGSFYTVGAGQRAVLLTWGEASLDSKDPGLNFKIPLAQKAIKITVQTQKYEVAASAASKDLQIVSSNIAVNYHLNPESVPVLYKDIGVAYQDRVIAPAVQEAVKAATAQFTAEELITERAVVKQFIQDNLRQRMIERGIIVEEVSIVNFDFSPQFNEAIEAKVTAEQQKLKAANDLERIKIEAQQVAVQGQGEADATLAKAKAEAEKIRLIQTELERGPLYVELQKWQRWDGKLPMNYMTLGNGATPLISIPTTNTTY